MAEHVLLVDDEPNILRVWRLELEDRGYRVSTAATGEDALALPDLATVAAVITDQHLPSMSGVELAAELARRLPGVPVILTTGGTLDPGTASEPGVPHVRAVLGKPFFVSDLVEALEGVLGARA